MANLLEEASILLTPTAYNDGKMLSVKPEIALGEEEVVNGDFATDSDWLKLNAAISGGKGNLDGDGQTSLLYQNILTQNKTYKATFTISNYNELGEARLMDNAGSLIYSITENGTFTINFKHTNSNGNFLFRARNGAIYSIDNVSVKEDLSGDFDFTRNSAATRVNAQGLVENVQILSSDLVSNGNFSQEGAEEVSNGSFSQEGSELVTNGDFDTDSDWVKGSGTTISDGKLNINFVGGGNTAYQSLTLQSNSISKVVVTCSSYTSGSLQIRVGSTSNGGLVDGVGTYTFYIKENGYPYINFFTDSGFIGSIDNVSVKEVGQDWNIGTGWSIGDGKVVFNDNANGDIRTLSPVFTASKMYKIKLTVSDLTSGTAFFGIGDGSPSNLVGYDNYTNGEHTFYVTAPNGNELRIYSTTSSGSSYSISNISIKEVGQDWTVSNGTITDKYNASLTAYQSGIRINPFIKTGTFKVVFDLVVTSGSCKFDAGGVNNEIYTTSGTKEILITNPTKFEFNAFNLGWVGTLDNVSVIEITDDTNLPRINYEGFSHQDSLGSELVSGSNSGDISSSSVYTDIYTNASVVNGKTYAVTFTAQDLESTIQSWSWVNYLPLDNSILYNNGTNTAYIIATGSGNLNLRFFSSSGRTGTLSNISIKEYLGQEVVPDSGCGSWLLEPQSTNLVTYSEDFSNASWSKQNNATITSNSTTSPSGKIDADLLNCPTTSRILNSISVTSGVNYTFSIFIKKGTSSLFSVDLYDGGSNTLIYNFDTSIVSGSITDNSIEDYGNGWYKLSGTITTASTTLTCLVYGNGGYSENEANTYIWGAQLEQQSFPTSYIPTLGAVSTRSGDLATNSGNASLINSTEGVLYAEVSSFVNGGIGDRTISISDGSTQNAIQLILHNTANRINFRMRSGGTMVVNISDLTFEQNQINKIACKYKSGDYALWINGEEKITSSSVSLPSNLNNISFNDGAVNNLYGNVKSIAVFKTALTDEQLIDLTTI